MVQTNCACNLQGKKIKDFFTIFILYKKIITFVELTAAVYIIKRKTLRE